MPPPAPAPPSAPYWGPERPPDSPTFRGQTVSWKGNSFRSDDGRTWIFQGSDAERARNAPVDPRVFRVLGPAGGTSFAIDQIREFCWEHVSDERGGSVDFELKINDIVSPELRASRGATREYVSPRLHTGCFTPPASYFRTGFDYEWSVEAISRTNTRRVAQDSFRRFSVATSGPTSQPAANPLVPGLPTTTAPMSAAPSCALIMITPGGSPSRYPREFRIHPVQSPFSARQIPTLTWEPTVDDAGAPVAYRVWITNILSPEQRAQNGQDRGIYSPLLCGTSYTPVGVGLEPWGDFEVVVEAISSSNATRVSSNSIRFSMTR